MYNPATEPLTVSLKNLGEFMNSHHTVHDCRARYIRFHEPGLECFAPPNCAGTLSILTLLDWKALRSPVRDFHGFNT
jgi:hypothetical protein